MPYGFNSNKTKIDVVTNSVGSFQTKDDLLDVNFSAPNDPKNYRFKVYYSPSSPPANAPYNGSQTFIGVWDYIWFAVGAGLVMVTELYPVPGRVWVNYAQSSQFSGWQHTPAEYLRSLTSTPLQLAGLVVERKQFGSATSIESGENKQFTFSVIKENHTFLGVVGAAPGNTNCAVTGITGKDSASTNAVSIWVKNLAGSAQTTTPVIWVLYATV